MIQSVYLGIDIGTSSAKCLAVDGSGRILALANHPYPIMHPHEGWAEQDAEDYWRALVDVVNKCVLECETQGYSRSDVRSIAMSTQGDTLIVTDDAGKPLAPAMSWMDRRGENECHELLSERDQSFWCENTGSALVSISSACNIRWIANNMPDLWNRIGRFCWVADFLANKLCGKFVTDVPNASWTPLYSSFKRDWSRDVMDLLGVSQEKLPAAVESGTEIGELLPEAALELGLDAGVKLVAGAFDQSAAAYGAGGQSVLSCGTAWVLYLVSDKPVEDESGSIPICCHTKSSEWGMILPFTGGSAYDWLHQTFGDRSTGCESGGGPLVFIPHLYGGLSPDWRSESKGSLLGLTLSHTWQDIELALMRGMAFETKRNIEAAEKICGRIEAVRMVGGAGKSRTWPQIIANVLNLPIYVSNQAEAACYGAAKIAAGEAAADWKASESVKTFAPVPDDVKSEERQYARYLRFYNALLPLYENDL